MKQKVVLVLIRVYAGKNYDNNIKYEKDIVDLDTEDVGNQNDEDNDKYQ